MSTDTRIHGLASHARRHYTHDSRDAARAIDARIRSDDGLERSCIVSNALRRERGRVACPLVAARRFGLAHGVGRSGDIAERGRGQGARARALPG